MVKVNVNGLKKNNIMENGKIIKCMDVNLYLFIVLLNINFN